MCFHCGSIYRTKFDNITKTEIETDGDKETETERRRHSDRNNQRQTEIDKYRNKGYCRPKAENTKKWTNKLDEDCITLFGLQ